MIKNFEEYKVYRRKFLAKDITPEESAKLRKEMELFKKKHPTFFRKMAEAKWENHFVTIN